MGNLDLKNSGLEFDDKLNQLSTSLAYGMLLVPSVFGGLQRFQRDLEWNYERVGGQTKRDPLRPMNSSGASN